MVLDRWGDPRGSSTIVTTRILQTTTTGRIAIATARMTMYRRRKDSSSGRSASSCSFEVEGTKLRRQTKNAKTKRKSWKQNVVTRIVGRRCNALPGCRSGFKNISWFFHKKKDHTWSPRSHNFRWKSRPNSRGYNNVPIFPSVTKGRLNTGRTEWHQVAEFNNPICYASPCHHDHRSPAW